MSNFEVLRAQTELGTREAELVQARNAQRLAATTLRRLLKLPQDVPIEVNARMDWVPLLAPAAELLELAYARRPDIAALEVGILAAEEDLNRVKSAYFPDVGLTAEHLSTDGFNGTVDNGWVVTLGAQWELVTGGRRGGERNEAKAEIRRLEHQLDELRTVVEENVTQARIQLENAIAQTAAQRQNVTLAREGLRLAELRFQEGVSTQSEVLDADLALTNAESQLVQALRDFAVANAGLELSIGKSWLRDYSKGRAAFGESLEAAAKKE